MPRFSLVSTLSILLAASLVAISALPAAAQRPRDETLNADQGWIDSTQSELDQQFELLVAAYDLDSQQQAALKQELQVRLMQEKVFEDKELAEFNALVQKMPESDDETPESRAALEKLNHIAKNMPTSEEQVVAWVDQQVGPKAKEGRMRWEELRTRTEAMRNDKEEAAAKNQAAELADARSKLEASTVPVTGQPLPGGEKEQRVWPTTEKKLDQQQTVPPNFADHPEMVREALPPEADKYAKWRPTVPKPTQMPKEPQDNVQLAQMAAPVAAHAEQLVKEDPAAAIPAGDAIAKPTPQAQPAQPAFATAPPLDDWDKYVISVSEKYKFDEPQITKAQSILRELKRRANQYRLSRADDLARAELGTDAKAREAQLKSLNRPMDAMFDELKQRLESLPTMEQRQKAAASPLEKKK